MDDDDSTNPPQHVPERSDAISSGPVGAVQLGDHPEHEVQDMIVQDQPSSTTNRENDR